MKVHLAFAILNSPSTFKGRMHCISFVVLVLMSTGRSFHNTDRCSGRTLSVTKNTTQADRADSSHESVRLGAPEARWICNQCGVYSTVQ